MGRTLLVDATSVFDFQQYLKQHDYPVQGNINYGALLSALNSRIAPSDAPGRGVRGTRVNRGCFDSMFAFVAINPEHEGQKKFCAYLREQGFVVDETDFRDAFIVPNREHPYQRLSTRVAYLAGMLAAPWNSDGKVRELPHLFVVSDAFDVYYPLLDYVQVRKGQATIAFVRRGLDDRFQRAGLFDADSPVGFCDFSDDAKAIFGADLGSSLGAKEGGKGLADFRL